MYGIGKLAASRLSTASLAGPHLGHGLLPVAAIAFRSWSSHAVRPRREAEARGDDQQAGAASTLGPTL
ncbi:hypothetical protein HaLaN_08520 [Haematococcus lacustris]|uniref:Uncharacterized protein n=1 Tax=Haematococcus lacustris TaxID=44745 RepID=A0A699YT50_HAELA|nr:hypothetical protein HaLaN_08520 [Haematococcus lacustris]